MLVKKTINNASITILHHWDMVAAWSSRLMDEEVSPGSTLVGCLLGCAWGRTMPFVGAASSDCVVDGACAWGAGVGVTKTSAEETELGD